jgi:hypothetical protein
MCKPSSTFIVSILLALSWIGFIVIRPSAGQQEQQPAKWSYATANDDVELARHGNAGWEAYAVTRPDPVGAATYYLKKPM